MQFCIVIFSPSIFIAAPLPLLLNARLKINPPMVSLLAPFTIFSSLFILAVRSLPPRSPVIIVLFFFQFLVLRLRSPPAKPPKKLILFLSILYVEFLSFPGRKCPVFTQISLPSFIFLRAS